MEFKQALAGRTVTLEARAQPVSVTDLVGLYGGTGAVAAELAGTSDRQSPEFKAAQRMVQRYRAAEGNAPKGATQERHPSARRGAAETGKGGGYAPKLADLRQRAAGRAKASVYQQLREQGGTLTRFHGEIRVSPGGPRETVTDRTIDNEWRIEPDTPGWQEFVDAAERGDWDTAGAAFEEAFFIAYDMGPAAVMGDTSDLDYRIGE